MADEFTLTARWVFPVTATPLEGGTVTVRDDRIVAVEPHGSRRADIDLGNVALTPGFVNAHTHLDLTGARGKTPPSPDFVGWLRKVIAYRRTRTPEQVAADVQEGIEDLLRRGTTLVGDIAADGATWDALSSASIRAVVFRELIGLSDERAAAAWKGFEWWRQSVEATETCRPGVSPHAPYSAALELIIKAAQHSGLPLSIHLAESWEEAQLLNDHTGPFVAFLQELDVWEPDNLADSFREVLLATAYSLSPIYAHGNFLRLWDADLDLPSHGTVVYCPRTHAAFGHPPHPFRGFLVRGVRVALGTDSLASNPDLSLLAESRFVRSRNPDVPGDVLLRMATLNGAEALGWADVTGSLDPGKSADFAIVALPDHDAADPHELLFESELPVVATWFRGRRVYNGRSPAPLETGSQYPAHREDGQ